MQEITRKIGLKTCYKFSLFNKNDVMRFVKKINIK